tara:strand:- start:160 stop:408 length:249 start_codon:yes stop_codon:yes gene_type:complete
LFSNQKYRTTIWGKREKRKEKKATRKLEFVRNYQSQVRVERKQHRAIDSGTRKGEKNETMHRYTDTPQKKIVTGNIKKGIEF